ncbi:MAG: MFS transporter [Actinobacteria bacterium]|nr:MFS transporter [Actinomycetota bacterium]
MPRGPLIDRRALGLLAAFGVFGTFWGGWSALLPEIKDVVDASDSVFGLALLGVGVGAFPAMLMMGPIYDRFGQRTVPPLLILFALTTLIPGLVDSAPLLFGSLIFLGAMSGMLDISVNAATTDWEAATGRRLMNLAHAVFSGFFLLASVSVGLARRADAGHMLILSCLALIVSLAAPLNRASRAEFRPKRERLRLRFEPWFLILGGLCGLGFVIEGGIESWSAVHLERTLGAGPAIGGLGPGLFAAAMVSGRTIAHIFGARVSDRRILVIGGSVTATGLMIAALGPSIPWALTGFVLAGLGSAVVAPTLFGLAGRSASEAARGSAVGTVTTVAYLGFLLGPPIVGVISGASSLRFGFGFLAVASLSLVALSGLIKSRVPATA